MADDSRQFREQTHGLIRETITKIAQVVVQSRITFGREVKTTENYWLHIVVDEIEQVSRQLSAWRNNVYLPLRIKIYFEDKKDSESAILLEEWKISFEAITFESDTKRIEVGTLNKRLVLQIRALYSYLRMMPAYKLFRDRIKQKNTSYQLNYKFTRPDQSSGAAEFGAAAISSFNFQEIKSSFGVLNVSVKYRKDFTPPQQNIQQVIVDNYKPEQVPRRQSMPPQPIPVPSPTNNANINNMTPSQPMSINPRVSPQDIYNRNRDAAQSAPITIPHKGRDRSYSTADVPQQQQSRPINMPGPSPGPRMPFIAEQSGPLKSPQFPSDFGVEATPPFSTNYLSTSSGAEGLNRFSNVSSTPPFKMASPPSSIFKPFKSPRFSSSTKTSSEKYTPFQINISPFRDSPLSPSQSQAPLGSSPGMITPSPPTGPALSPFNPIFYDDNDIPNLDLDDDPAFGLPDHQLQDELSTFIQDCQRAPSLSVTSRRETLSNQISNFEKIKDLSDLDKLLNNLQPQFNM
jgi:hypothetical protein